MNKNKYLVTRIKPCDRCQGDKEIYNPVWRLFSEEISKDNDSMAFYTTRSEWAQKRGYGNEAGMGNEYISCPGCGGTGEITELASLTDGLIQSDLLDEEDAKPIFAYQLRVVNERLAKLEPVCANSTDYDPYQDIADEARRNNMTDIDIMTAWRLGMAVYANVRKMGGEFPHAG
jgi:hypothetical protein